MADDWIAAARAALEREPTALVSVIGSEGSVPRGPGTRMVVTAGAATGTIGGGRLEHQALAQARAILDLAPGSWRVQDYPLGPLLGQCCGGRVRLLVERLDPAGAQWLEPPAEASRGHATLVTLFEHERLTRRVTREKLPPSAPVARGDLPQAGGQLVERLGAPMRPLMLFGAGHVGRAIVRGAAGLPLALAWFDTRAQWACTGVVLVPEEEALACAAAATAETAVAILTHDHAFDYRLARAALASPALFVGMIGSATKRARFLAWAGREGFDTARLTCPIGLAGIPGKAPEAIAVATLAQLLALGEPA